MSLYCLKRHHQVKEHRATRDSSSSVYVCSGTLEYRINGGGEKNRGGGLEMVRHNNNRGLLREIEKSPFLR